MDKRFDIIALGELNIDLILNNIDGFPEIGKEILADNCTMTLGSSTAIFASNACALGSRVAFVGMIGNDDFGHFIEKSLHERGVDTSMLIHTDKYNSGITVCMSYDQDRANVTYAGAMNYMGFEEVRNIDFGQTKHVHISSLFLQNSLKRDIVPILKYIKAAGCTTSLDTQWDPAQMWDVPWDEVLPLVDIFMPNAQELMALTKSGTIEDAVAAVIGKVNVLVIKNGSRGSIMLGEHVERREVPAILNEHPVDCIGAGDSFNSGFISAFVAGKSLPECQDAGNEAGALSTTAAGGTAAFQNIRK